MIRGIVDRIEDNKHIVIIFESEDKQIVCGVDYLPKEARHSGAVVDADVEGDKILEANYLPDVEEENREKVRRKRDEAEK